MFKLTKFCWISSEHDIISAHIKRDSYTGQHNLVVHTIDTKTQNNPYTFDIKDVSEGLLKFLEIDIADFTTDAVIMGDLVEFISLDQNSFMPKTVKGRVSYIVTLYQVVDEAGNLHKTPTVTKVIE